MSTSRYPLNSSGSSGSIRGQFNETKLTSDTNFQQFFKNHQKFYQDLINKKYLAGFLKKKNDLGPDKTPFIQRKWTDWYVELNGPTLMFWSVKNASECQESSIPTIKTRAPNFINIADCNVTTCEDCEGGVNVFVLNSAGANRFYFQTSTLELRDKWVLAMRLACFETSLLHDYYTSLVVASDSFLNIFNQPNFNSFEGFVEMRCSGALEWCRFWMSINDGNITFSTAKYSKDYYFSINMIQQAYAIFPDKLELVDQATVLRVDGEIQVHKDKELDANCPPFVIIMANTQIELVQILTVIYNQFHLYGRPNNYNPIPLPYDSQLYLDLNEISNLSVADVPFIDTRHTLLDIVKQKYNINQSMNLSIVNNDKDKEVTEQVINEEPEEESEEEHEEFEDQPSPQPSISKIKQGSGSIPSKGALVSALSTKSKPKPRKTFSVSWKEEHDSTDSEKDLKEDNNINIKQKSIKDSDDDDDDDEYLLKVNKSKVIRPGNKKADKKSVRKVQLDSSSESNDEDNKPIKSDKVNINPPMIPQLQVESYENELSNSIRQISLYDTSTSSSKVVSSLPRPNSEYTSNNLLKADDQQRPLSMSKSNSSNESIKKNKKKIIPRKKTNVPVGSDSDSEESDDKPLNNRLIKTQEPSHLPFNSSNDQHNNNDDDDDAPLASVSQHNLDPYSLPYNPNMMRASAYNNIPMEYGPDGMPYHPNEMMGYPPEQPFQPNLSNYNPALHRPSNLIEQQEYQRYNEQLLNQQRFGPLIQLPNKTQAKPSSGLVGAISAMEQQRAANKYTNANARRSQMHNPNPSFGGSSADLAFERQKERLLMEQRASLSQSQLFHPEFNLNHPNMGYSGYSQQPPLHRSIYGNANASLSAGSFYLPNQSNIYSSGSQQYLPPMEQNMIDPRMSMYRTMDDSMLNQVHPINEFNQNPSMVYNMQQQQQQQQQPYQSYPSNLRHSTMPSSMHPQNHINPNYHPNPNLNSYQGRQDSYISPNSGDMTPLVDGSDNDDDDDKPILSLNKSNHSTPATNPLFSKGRYREHTSAQLKSRKEESDSATESEPEIDDDIQETFDEFVDGRLQMKPYAFEPPNKVYQAFLDWCQDEDIDFEDVPDLKSFEYMMFQAGFVKKKWSKVKKGKSKSKAIEKEIEDKEMNMDQDEEWWYNIQVID